MQVILSDVLFWGEAKTVVLERNLKYFEMFIWILFSKYWLGKHLKVGEIEIQSYMYFTSLTA